MAERVGPYTLEVLLRTRGPAEAWSGRMSDGRRVAVTFSPLDPGDESAIVTLADRLTIAKRIKHPNLVEVLDGGHAGGVRYIVTELLDGIDLAQLLERARDRGFWLTAGTSGFIVRELSRALSHLHTLTTPEGVPLHLVHRDVAPCNVWLDPSGRVKLTDFLGNTEDQSLIKTAGHDQSGLIGYLSPELASSGQVDSKSDVFALGVILWELLTRRAPFLRDSDYETLAAVRTAELPSIPPDMPKELGTAALCCLARAPAVRPTADELENALDRAIRSLPEADSAGVASLVMRAMPSRTTGRPRTLPLDSNPAPTVEVPPPESPSGGSFGGEFLPELSPPHLPPPKRDEFYDSSRDGYSWEVKRFEVLGRLGAGGMGEVYRVRDRELDEVVALKLIPRPSTQELRSTERLKREVRLARKIASPHVCRIYDMVDLGGGARGLTMALIEGTTLAELMRAGVQVDYRRFARWGADIAEGMAAAHAFSIIHRDLKPENVMIRSDDRAVLLDFGIAFSEEAADQSIKLTQQGMIMGTPLYMSPEQLLNLRLDGRSDLFALGLMLAELVTGEVPMRGSSYPELVERRVTKPIRYRLRDIDPAAPMDLAVLVDELLHPVMADRPSDAATIAKRLREIGEHRTDPSGIVVRAPPGTTSPVNSSGVLPAPPRPSRSASPTMVVLGLVAVLLIGIGVWYQESKGGGDGGGIEVLPVQLPDAAVIEQTDAAEASDASEEPQPKADAGRHPRKDANQPAEPM